LIHTSLSLTLYWCSMSRHVSGITCPSSGDNTRTKNWWVLCAFVDVGWSRNVGRLCEIARYNFRDASKGLIFTTICMYNIPTIALFLQFTNTFYSSYMFRSMYVIIREFPLCFCWVTLKYIFCDTCQKFFQLIAL
jgi:hypothetical protein